MYVYICISLSHNGSNGCHINKLLAGFLYENAYSGSIAYRVKWSLYTANKGTFCKQGSASIQNNYDVFV